MIAIVDYGVGNLFSLKSSLNSLNIDAVVTADKQVIHSADRIILPGVGAFRDAAAKLKIGGMDEFIKSEAADGKPVLGICLGMQLLFEKSYEYGEYDGLGLIKGSIRPISECIPEDFSVPHMGWNSLLIKKETSLFKYINNGDFVYFVHSYYGTECETDIIATAQYGAELTAAVGRDNVWGCQFHPEKSGKTGLKILKAFNEL